MSLDSNWAEPKTNSSRDKEAAELYLKTHVSTYFLLSHISAGILQPNLRFRFAKF